MWFHRITDDRIKETSVVHRIFGGYSRSQVKCQCGYESNTFEPFLDLSVEITQANSVEKALAQFCAPEKLTGDNKYMCARYVLSYVRVRLGKSTDVVCGTCSNWLNSLINVTGVSGCVDTQQCFRVGDESRNGHLYTLVRAKV